MYLKLLYTHLVFASFPDELTLPFLLWAGRLEVFTVVGVYSESLASRIFQQEEYDILVDDYSFLTLGYAWGHFCMFACTLSHLALASLVCSSRLHPDLLYMVNFSMFYITCVFSL